MGLNIKVAQPHPIVNEVLPPTGKMPVHRSKKYNWSLLRQDFIRENLEPGNIKGMSLNAFSKKHNLTYSTLTEHAVAEGWEMAVEELRQELDEQVKRQLIAKVSVTEYDIRSKQAKYAAMAINKAILKLMTVNPEDLSVKDAIKMLQMGLTEERRALGLVESVSIIKNETIPQQEKVSAASQALAILERRRTLSKLESEITDVDSVDIAAAPKEPTSLLQRELTDWFEEKKASLRLEGGKDD